jgi:UDP-3-O-[3-hydroxymyristoyl] N-acetylglucosamine deacetylase
MTLRPAEPYTGVIFLRKDVAEVSPLVEARWHNVVDTVHCTVLGNRQGVTVGTAEHLLAALQAMGVDNLTVELDGPEVPIMDGSARPFVSLIERIGTAVQAAPRYALMIRKPVSVRDGDKFALLVPGRDFRVRVLIDFPGVGRQLGDYAAAEGSFGEDIAPARTFGFLEQIEALWKRGLAQGGNARNAVLLDGGGRVLNEEGLRFPDELVRHKILDVVGDLALVTTPILGRYIGYKPGHKLNHALLTRLFERKEAWCYRPLARELPAGLGEAGLQETG